MAASPLLQLPNTYRAFYGAFPALHSFQRDVIEPILTGQDLILQAPTGSGKTEAVLAPCLERVIRSGGTDAVLYIVPTRALTHDLRRRLEPLLHERLGLALGVRTGDVKRLPSGRADLLLTTPESLDVMLGSANREIRAFLQRVTMCVVDEVHQLVGGYRGRHLAYLLQRLERRSKHRLQKITLSATLAGPQAIRSGLHLQPQARWIANAVQRRMQPHLVHLKQEPGELVALIDDLAVRFGARKLLLFANSRSRCDQLFGWLRQRGAFQQATYLHYSNLKLPQRQEVERQFQRRSRALCIATSTLELGIDVGDVDSVILYEPPASVTTFLQRIGRANRQAQTTTFWGICRGPKAGEQLMQFLALYTLARQGDVEVAQPTSLPSVLAQQVLSTLYERKRLSLAWLQALFPQQAEQLETLMPALAARQWLRRLDHNGSQAYWRGGWRYARVLKAHQIWSNFPDTAEPYTLEVEAQAVADLPPVIVRQLEVGDHVDLAGRRIRILDIQTGDRKVVRAAPVTTPDEKELFWVGSGPPVSWEVAQAVRPLLQPEYAPDAELAQGLFTRTRALLQQQRQGAERRVVLHNGIELSRTPQGGYRYATYLGSVGNCIVQRTIEAHYGHRFEGFFCTADALAVTCSDRIDFQLLPLPLDRAALRRWASEHVRSLQALFEFNAFARALPREMLIDEATDLLWDERLLHAFTVYRRQSSEIATGDPQWLEWDAAVPDETAAEPVATWIRQGPQPTILAQEKARLGLTADAPPALPAIPAVHQTPRALTGTMVGNYMQHQQCDRLLSFDLLPYAQQPPKRALVDQALGAMRAEQGRAFEAQVITGLEQQGVALYRVPEYAPTGRRFSLTERQEHTAAFLTQLVREAVAQRPARGEEPVLLGVLVQPVLMLPACVEGVLSLDGVGIPDLIEVRIVGDMVELTIADIKDSAAPRYSQKWQVAFYAVLLQAWLYGYAFALPVQVAEHGVICTRPDAPGAEPARHAFALSPYIETFPLLQRRINTLLTTPVADASWQLQAHCTSCTYVDTCYRQALSTHDVMLLPHLTSGEYLKLRHAGLHTLSQAAQWAETESADDTALMSTHQAARLRARIRALDGNCVERLVEHTSLFPANISTVIFVRLLRDPRSGRPRAWGLQRLTDAAEPEPAQCWIAATEGDTAACQEAFCAQLQQWWQAAITADRGPHLVTFGSTDLRLLHEIMQDVSAPTAFDVLRSDDQPNSTDVRQLFARHFAIPAPLRYTLTTLAQVWDLAPALTPPPSLLQDESEEVEEMLLRSSLDAEHVDTLHTYLQVHLTLQRQLWHIGVSHVQSDWQRHAWETPLVDADQTLERACVAFLEGQQAWRERDILAVQQLPLAERVARYRALGPLVFEETSLDDEGRFLAHFRIPDTVEPTRFRPGDFLRLNAVGSPDLQGGSGVILAQYEPHTQRLAVMPRRGRLAISGRLRYVLDEDLEDWTTPRVIHAVREALSPGTHPHITALVQGVLPLWHAAPGLAWAERWLERIDLNARQRQALLLPFRSRLGLIEGPPGTGKTHVLAWMLIALILEASQAGRPLRLVVSALTHQAIDNVLLKVQQLLRQDAAGRSFPGRCLKWGRRLALSDDADDAAQLTYVESAEEVWQTPYLILGATGFGLYQLFDSRSGQFPAFFDWVIVDEASQMLLPQALLSLIYGKGHYVFCGDVQQLPPVIRGPQSPDGEAVPERSILAHLLETYDPRVRVRLNETYRLNRELCALPSRLWYQGDLRPAAGNAAARYTAPAIGHPDRIDAILDPQRPTTLVLTDHTVDHQQSAAEVEMVAALAARLLLDYGLEAARLAILAPHRAQNNAIAQRLGALLAEPRNGEAVALPLIDTVERLQGAERDIVLFSLTTSDPDYLESPFLNSPNRFNVAMTRARHKLVVVGSRAFFTQTPRTEAGLLAHQGFTAYYRLCQVQNALFE